MRTHEVGSGEFGYRMNGGYKPVAHKRILVVKIAGLRLRF